MASDNMTASHEMLNGQSNVYFVDDLLPGDPLTH